MGSFSALVHVLIIHVYFTTFQNIVHVYYANWAFMVDHVQIWFLLPISGLPYTGLLYKAKRVKFNSS